MRVPYVEFHQNLSKKERYTCKYRGTHPTYEWDMFGTTEFKSNLSYNGNTK